MFFGKPNIVQLCGGVDEGVSTCVCLSVSFQERGLPKTSVTKASGKLLTCFYLDLMGLRERCLENSYFACINVSMASAMLITPGGVWVNIYTCVTFALLELLRLEQRKGEDLFVKEFFFFFFFFFNTFNILVITEIIHSINYTNKKLLKKVFHCMLVHRTHNRSGISTLDCNCL